MNRTQLLAITIAAAAIAVSAVAPAQSQPGDWQFNYQHTFGAGRYQALTWTPVKSEKRWGFTWEVGPGLAEDLDSHATAFAGFVRGMLQYDAKQVKVGLGPSFYGFYTPSTGHWLGRTGLALTVTFPAPTT